VEAVEVGQVGDVTFDARRLAADHAHSGIEFRLSR
jgi:hypothetical protein